MTREQKISISMKKYHRSRKRTKQINIILATLSVITMLIATSGVAIHKVRADMIIYTSEELELCNNGMHASDCEQIDDKTAASVSTGSLVRLPKSGRVEEAKANDSTPTVGLSVEQKRLKYIQSLDGKVKRNNPGNLVAPNGQFMVFPGILTGFAALMQDIEAKKDPGGRLNSHSTIREFLTVYSPPHENDTEHLIEQMSYRLNLPETTPIGQINTFLLAQDIVRQEWSIVY